MGAAENRVKSQKAAEYMKKKGITRNSGACPWGCGSMITNGGQALINHLKVCRGGGAKRMQGGGKSKRR